MNTSTKIDRGALTTWENNNEDPHQVWPLFSQAGEFLGTVNGDGWLNNHHRVEFQLADVRKDDTVWIHEAASDIAIAIQV